MMFKEKIESWFYILYCASLILFFLSIKDVEAQTDQRKPSTSVEGNVSLGSGYDSNVFLSANNAQSDTFLFLESSLTHFLQLNKKSILLTLFDGSHQRYLELDQANNTFVHLTSYLRHATSDVFSAAFSNTLSYMDFRLLDSEGDALPTDQFKAVSDQIKLYALYRPSKKTQFKLGIFYQFFNVAEVNGQTSLDYEKKGIELRSRIFLPVEKYVHISYKWDHSDYEERQAKNRSTSFDGNMAPTNPKLKLNRQELTLKYKDQPETRFHFKIIGKYRLNDDLFEDHLSYRQAEIKGQIEQVDLGITGLSLEMTYRNRRYTDRKNVLGSQTRLKEKFLITNITFAKKIRKWLKGSIAYSHTKKTSNDSENTFSNHHGRLSIEAIW